MLHLLAILAVIVCRLPVAVVLGVTGMIGMSLWLTLRTHVFLTAARSIRTISWHENDEWELGHADAQNSIAKLDTANTVVLYWMMVLRLSAGQRRLTLVLLPDMLDEASWRVLAVRLRSLRRDR